MSCPSPACVVKVGHGRGFVISHRVKLHRPKDLPRGVNLRRHRDHCYIITAAHCLPQLPPAHAESSIGERTCGNLLGGLEGNLDGSKNSVWAECLFADPVADIAVLGSPDSQVVSDKANAYDAFMENRPVLRMGDAKSGPGWRLSLDGQWVRITLERYPGLVEVGPTKAGQSGSPILDDRGRAVGLIVVTGPQPILTRSLPGWLLNSRR